MASDAEGAGLAGGGTRAAVEAGSAVVGAGARIEKLARVGRA